MNPDEPVVGGIASAPTEVASDDTVTSAGKREAAAARQRHYGRYELMGELGAGGMGIVYEAYDPELDRRVALKVIGQSQRAIGTEARARLLREARAMARLSHPNVIAIHDVGSVGDEAFVAMELVHGRTLKEWLRDEAPSLRQILDVFGQAGRGLTAAHSAGLVHRDFKPSNVMVDDHGRVRVLDFGLARLVETDDADDGESMRSPSAVGELTRTGGIVGTPAYMAPEQCVGGAVDERTDQFSFCVALHEALYGVAPFSGSTIEERAAQIEAGDIASDPGRRRISKRLRAAVLRGLQANPADRHPSMDALLDELASSARTRRRRRVAVVAVAVLALLGVAGGLIALGARTRSPRVAATSAGDRSDLRVQIAEHDSELMRRLGSYVEQDDEARSLGIEALPATWRFASDNKQAHEEYLAAPDRKTLDSYLATLFRQRPDLAPEPGHEVVVGREWGRWRTYYVWTRVELDGSLIARAEVRHEEPNGHPAVLVEFNDQGKARLAAVTGQNIGRREVVIVDGVVVWAPIIESAVLGGAVDITTGDVDRGNSEEAARLLARSLSRGH